MSKELIRKARIQAVWSYLHKLLLVIIACCGFLAVHWLGKQTTWEAGPRVQEVVRAAVATAFSTQGFPSDAGDTVPGPPAPNQDKACDPFSGPVRSFESRDQLIAAMQDRAEACVWATFGRAVKTASANLVKLGTSVSDQAQLRATSDFIAREELLAGVTAQAARQLVFARLTSMPLPLHEDAADNREAPGKGDWFAKLIRRAAVPESGARVLLEMLTYACLLGGVVATSILVIIVLTALPITSAQGYWTDRIGKILDRLPSAGSSLLAVPLAAAAIGSGALVTLHATDLSNAWHIPTAATPAPAATPPPSGEGATKGETHRYRYGGNTYYLDPREPVDFGPMTKSLSAIDLSTHSIDERTAALGTSFAQGIAPMAMAIAQLSVEVKQEGSDLTALRGSLQGLRGDIEVSIPASSNLVVAAVDQVREAVDDNNCAVSAAVERAAGLEERQLAAFTQLMGQGFQIDERDFKRRLFSTQYQVGPAIPTVVEASLKSVEGEQASSAMAAALQAMSGGEPMDEDAFKLALAGYLQSELSKIGLPRSEADRLLDRHWRALKQECALSRQ